MAKNKANMEGGKLTGLVSTQNSPDVAAIVLASISTKGFPGSTFISITTGDDSPENGTI